MNETAGRAAPALVLVADDDAELAQEIMDFLGRYEFRCVTAGNWDDTVGTVERDRPDAIILDQWLGDVDTLPRLPELRQLTGVPVLILTSNQEAADRIVGLELGADDFLCKPVSGRELVARVRAQLRGRQRTPARESPSGQAWFVDAQMQQMRRPDGTPVHLTTAEFALLAQLMKSPGEMQSRGDLTRAVFGRPWRAGDRAVDSIVVNLRLKIDRAGGTGKSPEESCIRTVRNIGYTFIKLPDWR